MFISMFGFNQTNFLFITIILVTLGIALYLFLSKSLLDPLFKSDEQIQNLIKETLHELNTPVATIQINTQMIKRKEENPKNKLRLEKIEKSCDNLLNLYTKMEYDLKKEVDSILIEEFNLKDMIISCIENFDDIKNNVEIINEIKEDLFIKTDKNGFERIINNLISNAIKYNKPDGFVKFTINNSIISIEDSGVGIDTKNLFKVFDRYYQQDIKHDGVGLGLNIVKEFCDKYKIKINIESDGKSGTTFFLDLLNIR